jgi:hypothetical protein
VWANNILIVDHGSLRNLWNNKLTLGYNVGSNVSVVVQHQKITGFENDFRFGLEWRISTEMDW